MFDPYDAYDHAYGPGGSVRRALARIPPRLALGAFLACWTATQVWMILAGANGEPTPLLITHWLLLPTLAAVLVGWWRGGVAGTLAGSGASLLVILANAIVVLLLSQRDGGERTGGDWDLLRLGATLAFLLGLVGGAVGAAAHSSSNP